MTIDRDLTLTLVADALHARLEFPAATVVVEEPSGTRREQPLGLIAIEVGSGADCTLCVEDPLVSRRHAELRRTRGGVHLRDLESKNGTFIGDVRIVEAFLPPGVWARVGGTRFQVQATSELTRVELAPEQQFGEAVGQSPVMRALFATLTRAAKMDVPLLLQGETGTGKELLARALHEHSNRREGPFVVFDCSSVAPTLAETELFGHVAGAFTGADRARQGILAQAHGGTLFLDEIGELPLELQPKLLRALEAKSYRPLGDNEDRAADVRIVAATHRDLPASVARKAFRADLYYRLAAVTAAVPPLRERKEDIPLLVGRLLERMTPPRQLADVPAQLLRLLEKHDWPGNVRELANTVTRLVHFPGMGIEQLGAVTARAPSSTERAYFHLPLKEAREAMVGNFELGYLRHQLLQNGGNVTATAKAIGVSRQYLYRLMDAHGLTESTDG